MTRITETFQKLKTHREAALIGYVTAGDPEPQSTPKIAEALIEGGVDILELGLPFSDPIADGPTIQAASGRALDAGTTPRKVLETSRKIRQAHDTPLVIMTYYNPVFRMGLNRFFRLAKECLIDGIIVPDLPVEEGGDYTQAASASGIDTIFLAAPSTSTQRLRKIVKCSSGFLYLVSHFGVTGAKAQVEQSTIQLIKKVLPHTRAHVPLAVGFGVSKPEHARCIIEAGADGVIVGSTFVNIIAKNRNNMNKMLEELSETAHKIKTATLRADS
ncbi:MAG: tryptophan synthase subunit alpha [Candidatus Bathyarchaeota archaeon]|nr:tryptophan synthase subunit alpha [Candidatus Bathyarchaeota archaeon]